MRVALEDDEASVARDAVARLSIEGEQHEYGERAVLRLYGDLDVRGGRVLEAALVGVRRAGVRALTLDLRGLTFIDSSGLWTVIAARRWCDRGACHLTLVPGPPHVHEVFEMTGLSEILPFVAPHARS